MSADVLKDAYEWLAKTSHRHSHERVLIERLVAALEADLRGAYERGIVDGENLAIAAPTSETTDA